MVVMYDFLFCFGDLSEFFYVLLKQMFKWLSEVGKMDEVC